MTVSVTVKHQGPDTHDIEIDIYDPWKLQNGATHILKAGKEITVFLDSTHAVSLIEVPVVS